MRAAPVGGPPLPPPLARRCPCVQERFARKNEVQQLRWAFELLDSNHDGQIDADELRGYFDALGHKTRKVPRQRRGLGPPVPPYLPCRGSHPGSSPLCPAQCRRRWRT